MKKSILILTVLALTVAFISCSPDNDGGGKQPSKRLPEGKTYAELCFKYKLPTLNFELGMYKLSSAQSEGWPFRTSDYAIKLYFWPKGEKPYQRLSTLGTSTIVGPITPGTDYSIFAYSAEMIHTQVTLDTTKPTPSSPTSMHEGYQPDDIFALYLPTYEAPTGYGDYEKRTDENLGEIYVCSDSVTLVPFTKPYQIEILDPSGQLTSVEDIAFTGFADGIDLITGAVNKNSSEIYIEQALPVQAYTQVSSNGERNFIGNVTAIQLRTWGRVASEDIVMTFSAMAKGERFKFSVTLTDEVSNLPDGGVIAVTLPNGTF